jgi:phosphopantothenoylcysteine decarboxylase / phosphopantothenate---cysteine ligase
VRLLREEGHEVRVVPTESALRFVGAPTWEALSGNPVSHEVWQDVPSVGHVALGRWADLVIVAPATADLLARAAAGLADDLLTTSLLTATCPVLFAPAMHTEMWLHPATQANVGTLAQRGGVVLPPAVGRLTGADSGPGRLPEPEEIKAAALDLLRPATELDLVGVHVVVSAGGTREPWDPVRYLGNRSSGRQGVAIAERARARGAQVTLVAAHLEVTPPMGVDVREVGTAAQLHTAMIDLAEQAEVIIMAAAVADFRPAEPAPEKIKKRDDPAGAGEGHEDAPTIALTRNVDVLADLVARRSRRDDSGRRQVIVGFAAETGDLGAGVLEHGRAKLAGKGCDVLVVNDVSGGRVFGEESNEVTILVREGDERAVPRTTKAAVADTLLDVVSTLRQASR